MLTISDYSQAHHKCTAKNTCVTAYTLLVSTDSRQNVVSVTMTVDPTAQLEESFVSAIRLYGLNPKKYNHIELSRETRIAAGAHSIFP